MKVNKSLMRAYRARPDRVREIFETARNTDMDREEVRRVLYLHDPLSFYGEFENLWVQNIEPLFRFFYETILRDKDWRKKLPQRTFDRYSTKRAEFRLRQVKEELAAKDYVC